MRAWTQQRAPFRLGGQWDTIACEVEAGEPIDLGNGVAVRPVTSPSGRTYYVEAVYGSLHGTDLAALREDVATADRAVLAEQLAMSASASANPDELLDASEFWRRVERSR